MNTVDWAGCLGRYNWPEVERPNRTANGLVHYYSTESPLLGVTRGQQHISVQEDRSTCRGFRTLFNRGDFRTTSTSGAGRSRRSGNHVALPRTGPRKWCGGHPGPRGSRSRWFRMLSLQVWTRMFLLLHGHMRGSIRREICDFQASISPDHLKYQEFLSFAAAQKGGLI